MINYFSTITENILVPWRTGNVDISIGKTSYNGLTQCFLMIDNLSWLFRLKPSFVFLFPSFKSLSNDGSKTNIEIFYPRYADKNMEFKKLNSGTASLKTYFFGHPKDDRSFDFYYRFFENGFTLTNFKNLDSSELNLTSETSLEISSKDYKDPDFMSGNNTKFKIKARIQRKR